MLPSRDFVGNGYTISSGYGSAGAKTKRGGSIGTPGAETRRGGIDSAFDQTGQAEL
jgi:hypothetical protein